MLVALVACACYCLYFKHDMYDYFSYNFVSRGTQIDYGRLPRGDMIDYIKAIAKILNTSKALKGRKLFKKRSFSCLK